MDAPRRLPLVLPVRHVGLGWIVAAVGLPLLTLILSNVRDHVRLSGALLAFLLLDVGVAIIGGIWPAVGTAVASFVITNYYFTPPLYTFTIYETHNLLAQVVFLIVAAIVSGLVSLLARRETEASRATAVNDLRAALLAAVSHDLRTPLSSIKASVSSLLQTDVEWPKETATEFLRTIDEETDRLNKLVGNLLDMSRLQSGGLNLDLRPVGLEEVVGSALSGIGGTQDVDVDVPETLAPVLADPALLERAVANIVSNAITHGGGDVRIEAFEHHERIELRVIDHGRGIAPEHHGLAFLPFQRLDDHGPTTGVGLGLSVAHGFVAAMHGSLALAETPGGGLTVTTILEVAA
jgi:two-component system, OmpR family, sensor histidine kinase KdpD